MKPRRWYQLHLTTCIFLMFEAAGIVALNVLQHRFRYPAVLWKMPCDYYGWPCMFFWKERDGNLDGFLAHWLIFDILFAIILLALSAWIINRQHTSPNLSKSE